MSKPYNGPTELQMNLLLLTQATIAACGVATLLSAARAALKVKETTDDAKDFIQGAKQAL